MQHYWLQLNREQSSCIIFISFIIKIMIQKRNHVQDGQQSRKNTIPQRENEGQRFRYLVDLPEYSAVVENPQSLRNLGASEASLLDKIGLENDRICNSSLFDENRDKIFDTRVVDDLKFSFSHHEGKDPIQKQPVYSDLAAKYHHEYARVTANLNTQNSESLEVRRQKQVFKEETVNQSIETIKNKYIVNQEKGAKKHFDRVKIELIPEEKEFNDLDSFSKDNYMRNIEEGDKRQDKSFDKVFQKVLIDDKQKAEQTIRDEILPLSKQGSRSSSIRQKMDPKLKTINSLQKLTINLHASNGPIDNHYLQILFESLDRNKTGKIDKYNCNIQNIREEFQLIFGLIFFRIKFNSESFNRKEFVSLCNECLRLLHKQTLIRVLCELDPNWQSQQAREKQEKQHQLKQNQEREKMLKEKQQRERTAIQREQKNRILKVREEKEKMVKEREQRQNMIKEIEEKQKRERQQRQRIIERQERERKTREQQSKLKMKDSEQSQNVMKYSQQKRQYVCSNCKSQSKLDEKSASHYRLLDSPPKERCLHASRPIPQSNDLSINKRPYVNLKQTRYENKLSQQLTKSQTIQINILKEKGNHEHKYLTSSSINNQLAEGYGENRNYSTQKERKVEEMKRLEFKLQEAVTAQGNPKKKRNISEEILREHKKNLEELHKLNDKMEKYISHKPVEIGLTLAQNQSSKLRHYETSYSQAIQELI